MSRRFALLVLVALAAGATASAALAVRSAFAPAGPGAPVTIVTTFAGDARVWGSVDGSGSAARFYCPDDVACDAAGNVYVADTDNATIRKITPDGVVSTLAGDARAPTGSADGVGSAARFDYPGGVACDSTGNVYVADSLNNTIRKITPDGVVSTLAGDADVPAGHADGAGAQARFDYPAAVACDAAGNVYVADSNNCTIRKITPDGVVSTLAGKAGAKGHTDGMGAEARFKNPVGLVCDAAGHIYVADSDNQTIRMVSSAGNVTTVAGKAGVYGVIDGPVAAARLDSPVDVACDGAVVYLAEFCSIRRVAQVVDTSPPTTTASAATAKPGKKAVFRFKVDDPPPSCGFTAVTLRFESGGRMLHEARLGYEPTNVDLRVAVRIHLRRGVYTYIVLAVDAAGNAAGSTRSATLRVK